MRTDLHRPSVIVPQDYTEVAYLPHVTGFGTAPFVLAEAERLARHMKQTGGTWAAASHGSCDICGNVQAMSHVIFYHKITNSYLRVGEICASKMNFSWDRDGYSAFKLDYKQALEFRAGKAKAKATLAEAGREWAWDIYTLVEASAVGSAERANLWNDMTREDQTAYDMVSKLVRYGSLSDKQLAYLDKLPEIKARHLERKLEWAKRDQVRRETSTHVGAIGERRTFTATIRFAKFFENQFGRSYNDGWTLTVMDDDAGNVLVWKGKGFGAEKGEKVTFKATVKEHSERDGVKQTIVTRCKAEPQATGPEAEASQTPQNAPRIVGERVEVSTPETLVLQAAAAVLSAGTAQGGYLSVNN